MAVAGITNQQFADALGIHFSMASRLFSGHRLPSADLIYRIHQVYGIPLEDLHAARDKGGTALRDLLRDRIALNDE